jgi:hypothetical protein
MLIGPCKSPVFTEKLALANSAGYSYVVQGKKPASPIAAA